MGQVVFRRTTPDDAVAVALIDALSAELAERYVGVYPLDGRSNYRAEHFDAGRDAFLVGEIGAAAVLCGALRWFDVGVVELKRMYVAPPQRGRGLGRALLGQLEALASELGYHEVLAETGSEQPEAIALYVGAGYEPTAPWPPYDTRDYARCYRKVL